MPDYGLITESATELLDWDLVTDAVDETLDWGLLSEDSPAATSILTRLADAIVAALNAGTWSQEFTAERVPLPQFTLPELATLEVPVAVRGSYPKRLTRAHSIKVVEIDVGVLRKLDATGVDRKFATADVDPYITLVDEIVDYFHDTRLAGFTNVLATASRPDPVYDPEQLEKKRAFVAVIQLEFKVFGS